MRIAGSVVLAILLKGPVNVRIWKRAVCARYVGDIRHLRTTFACILRADLTELTSIVYNFKFHMRSYVSEKVSLRTNLHSVTHLFLK